MASVLDHILLATPDFEATVSSFEELTGIRPELGGDHTDSDTRNAIVRLETGLYLEILAARAGTESNDPWAVYCSSLDAPALMTFAMRSSLPMAKLYTELSQKELAKSNIVEGGRITPQGRHLTWQYLDVIDSNFGLQVPFFIEWDDTHPSDDAENGLSMLDFRIKATQPQELKAHLSKLDVDMHVEKAIEPGFSLTLNTPKGQVEFL